MTKTIERHEAVLLSRPWAEASGHEVKQCPVCKKAYCPACDGTRHGTGKCG